MTVIHVLFELLMLGHWVTEDHNGFVDAQGSRTVAWPVQDAGFDLRQPTKVLIVIYTTNMLRAYIMHIPLEPILTRAHIISCRIFQNTTWMGHVWYFSPYTRAGRRFCLYVQVSILLTWIHTSTIYRFFIWSINTIKLDQIPHNEWSWLHFVRRHHAAAYKLAQVSVIRVHTIVGPLRYQHI